MNRIHRTVWNERRQAYMVAAENTSAGGQRSGVTGALLISTLTGVMLGVPAQAAGPAPATLPTGAIVTAGQAQIAQSGAAMTVNQGSAKAAIEWTNFSIGKDATVNFVQPNASAVALNRVKGNEGSVIEGALKANGQVFILNPNGVLFGSGARVDTAGLVATTLALSDADFMAGKTSFSGRGGSVRNEGSLNARDGGYVALLGAQVRNDGQITARMGTVALAAGNKISLNFNGDSLVGVVIEEAALGALVANGQAIRADGGLVVLTAKAADHLLDTVVNNSGEIRARSIENKAGKIFLLGEGGAVEVAGQLDASAPSGGNGGFIETSGPVLRVADGARLSTAAAHGVSGTWLIDPTDFTIASGSAAQGASGIGASTLQTALGAGNVTIQTQASGTEAGNINVNAPVAWSANKLTLEAHGNINVNAVMSATGTSQLDMKSGYNFNVGSPAYNPGYQVLMGIVNANSFGGRIDFDRSGSGILSINGAGYKLINALGAAGSTTTTDLQGISGSGGGKYALAGDINASTTSAWNAGAGFTPIAFSGAFDGLGHAISGLAINQPSGTYVGLFGTNSGVVRNLAVTSASINANQGAGVLAGLSMGSLFNIITSGTVNAPGGYVGAMVGGIFDGQVSNVHVAGGSVTSAGNNVGGLAGYLAYHIPLNYSSSSASVTGTGTWTGGLVGQNDYGYINYSSASGDVSGRSDTGGLVGNNNSGMIIGSYATGTVTGTTNTGGLVGNDGNGGVRGSYATGSVQGTGYVGGLIGLATASGGTATADNEINTSYSTGAVIASGDRSGGLIGRNYGNNVTDTYSRSAVSSSGNFVGGLIGENLGTVNNSYSTGAVATTGLYAGGLIGVSIGGVTNSFWDKQTSGQNSSGDGTGKTTAQMKVDTLYTDAGWNFTFHSGVWGRKDALNDGYPVLRAFGYVDPITITLNNLALAKSYGGANPTLGASGWTVSGCDNNATCVASVDWGTVINAFTNAGNYSYTAPNVLAVTLGTGYGKPSDYAITYTTGSLTVNPALLTVSGSSVANKVYDRSNVASLTLGALSGLMNGENLTLSASGAVFDSANAGSRTASANLSLSEGTGVNAGNPSNYVLSSNTLTGLAGTITPRPVNLVGQSAKIYDRSSLVAASLVAINNIIPGDSVVLSGSALLASANVGVQPLSDLSGLSINNPNYTLTGATTGLGVGIFPRLLGVHSIDGATRLYNGTATAGTDLLALSGVLDGDSVTITGGGATLAGKNVGSRALVSIDGMTIDNTNYSLIEATITGNVAITALPLNVAAIVNASKVYDRLDTANASLLQATNVVSGDVVALGGHATLASKDAGSRAVAGVSGLTIENSNYTLVGGTYSGDVLITPRLVGAQALDGATRRYDGTTNVAGSLLTLGGIMEGDSVTLSGSALMAGKDVGTHALTDTGSLALSSGNYALTGASGEVAVTPLPVQVAGANSRPYDGTTAAAANLLRVANAASGETVTLGGSATLVAKNAGLEAISDLSGLTLSDSNYTLAGASAIGGVTVTPIPLNVTVQTGATRPFNGRSEVATDLLQLDGILPGDHVGLSGNGTLAAPFGTVPATGLGSLAIDNSDYRLAGISGTVDIQAPTTVSNEPIISQAQRTDPPSVAQVLSVAQAGSESRAVLNPMPPNVVSSPLRLSAAFGDGVPLTLISSPGPGEHSESVTLAQARGMVSAPSGGSSSGDREVRVPVSRNSLAEIVNGGLKLPGGVDQLLFVVKGN